MPTYSTLSYNNAISKFKALAGLDSLSGTDLDFFQTSLTERIRQAFETFAWPNFTKIGEEITLSSNQISLVSTADNANANVANLSTTTYVVDIKEPNDDSGTQRYFWFLNSGEPNIFEGMLAPQFSTNRIDDEGKDVDNDYYENPDMNVVQGDTIIFTKSGWDLVGDPSNGDHRLTENARKIVITNPQGQIHGSMFVEPGQNYLLVDNLTSVFDQVGTYQYWGFWEEIDSTGTDNRFFGANIDGYKWEPLGDIIVSENPNGMGYAVMALANQADRIFRIQTDNPIKNPYADEHTFVQTTDYLGNPIVKIIGDKDFAGEKVYVTYRQKWETIVAGAENLYGNELSQDSNIPLEFFNYGVHGAYVEFLKAEGQTSKAQAEEQIAQQLLASEISKVTDQGRQFRHDIVQGRPASQFKRHNLNQAQ